MRTRFRIAIAAALLALAAVALALVAGTAEKAVVNPEGVEHQGLAFSRHQQDLFVASHGSRDKEGPMSYADQMAQLNAYPNDAVTAENVAGAQQANAAITARGVGQGKNSTSSWYSLGPTNAIYPAVLNRHGSQYVTSGRITALAVKPGCSNQSCTVWVASAGGGVWRTDKGLSGNGNWVNVSDGFFGSGAIGALTYDAKSGTLYAGTGELAAASDAEAGVGIYASKDDGTTWTALGGNSSFTNRAIRQITIDPSDATGKTFYVADGRGVHGINGTDASPISNIPNSPAWGILKTTDGGQTFTVLAPQANAYNGQLTTLGAPRGFTDVQLDPSNSQIVYASSYAQGAFRSTDGGATWTKIFDSLTHYQSPFTGLNGSTSGRTEFAVAKTSTGHTRMYLTWGDSGSASGHPYSRFYIADDVQTGTPTFVDKTSSNPASPGYATYDFCTGQCWYDQGVYVPAEDPNMVYIFGSYVYGEAGGVSNARALLLSRDGGNTFTDLTEDATSATAPNGLHPDQHALVTVPGKPLQFFEGSDGGLMRSDGTLTDTSSRCDSRGLSGASLDRCKQLLSAVPGQLVSLNNGLQTLQFQGLSVNPANPKNVQGGTQDNGTFETNGSSVVWPQTIFGDGGLSGFDAANPAYRFHTYYQQQVDSSFANGAPTSWDWISDPLFNYEWQYSLFYMPIISDPVKAGSLFAGISWVWRTQDNGGNQADLDKHCNEFTGDFPQGYSCGDWVPLGAQNTNSLSSSPLFQGSGRSGGVFSWVARSTGDTGTLWSASTLGRVFVTHNADAADHAAVTFTRIDNVSGGTSPARAISGIYVDPTNSNHAWISYLGYNASTPAQAGHVFSVTYNPSTNTATWTAIDGGIGDQPVNAVAEDAKTGDLYAATDFGVLKLANGSTTWTTAATGLPVVTVAGLTINPGARQLLAATHGRGAYQLTLP